MANPFEYLARQACKRLEEDNSLTIIQKIEIFEEVQRDCLYAANRISDFFEWKNNIVSFKTDFPTFSYNRKQDSLSFLEDVFSSLDFSKISKIKNLKFKQRAINPFYKIYFKNLKPVNELEKILKYMFLNNIHLTYLSVLKNKGIIDYKRILNLDSFFPYRFGFYSLDIKVSKFSDDYQFSLQTQSIELPFIYYPKN